MKQNVQYEPGAREPRQARGAADVTLNLARVGIDFSLLPLPPTSQLGSAASILYPLSTAPPPPQMLRFSPPPSSLLPRNLDHSSGM
jgi:hypothetical protein